MKNTPSPSSLVEKALKLSLSNIWRNKFLSIATIFVVGTIIFIFNVIISINFIANSALTDLNKKVDITVYLKESTTYENSQKIMKEISIQEGVENVTYTSKEDALKQIQQTHPDISLAFEKYNLGNPLPASINITTTHPKFHKPIADILSQEQYKTYTSNIITSNETDSNAIITSVSKNLLEVTNFANQLIFWIILIFAIGGVLIVLNAIQIAIFTRKKEIEVMQLVGASHWFIKLPFVIESIIYSILAVLLSFLMLWVVSKNITIKETSLFSYFTNLKFQAVFFIELIATILIGISSSLIAVHEYLQKKFIEN